MADISRLSVLSLHSSSASLLTSFASTFNSPQLPLSPNSNLDKKSSSFSHAVSVSTPRKKLLSFKVHATITETNQPKWWEKNAGPNMIDIHSTQEFLTALSEAGDRLVIVEFYGTWCASCKALFPKALENMEWPDQFPFKDEDFRRFDETADTLFYESPRFVTHIDDPAIAALTKYYSEVFPPSNTPGVSMLDMCSSWISHFPKGYKQERVVGMGLNEEELKRNPVLTEFVVQDLNLNPKLPFEDNSFDVVTNVVSVDYLTKPLDVFKEMCRILKPGGLAIMSFSNRCFFTKAISVWTSTGDADHAVIVGAYFHYAGGFEPPKAVDISPNPGRSDPMYIVYSRKLSTA